MERLSVSATVNNPSWVHSWAIPGCLVKRPSWEYIFWLQLRQPPPIQFTYPPPNMSHSTRDSWHHEEENSYFCCAFFEFLAHRIHELNKNDCCFNTNSLMRSVTQQQVTRAITLYQALILYQHSTCVLQSVQCYQVRNIIRMRKPRLREARLHLRKWWWQG